MDVAFQARARKFGEVLRIGANADGEGRISGSDGFQLTGAESFLAAPTTLARSVPVALDELSFVGLMGRFRRAPLITRSWRR